MNDLLIIQAYVRTRRIVRVSADELVCTPEARALFLSFAREGAGSTISERDLLWRLLCLRKRSRLPRSGDSTVANDAAVA